MSLYFNMLNHIFVFFKSFQLYFKKIHQFWKVKELKQNVKKMPKCQKKFSYQTTERWLAPWILNDKSHGENSKENIKCQFQFQFFRNKCYSSVVKRWSLYVVVLIVKHIRENSRPLWNLFLSIFIFLFIIPRAADSAQ